MSHPSRIFRLVGAVGVLAVAGVGGMAYLHRRGLADLGQVMKSPDQFAGQVIRLRGAVGQIRQVELLGVSGFRLVSGRDSIWVVGSGAPPLAKSTVVVQGTVRAAGLGELIRVGPVIWDAVVEPAPWP